MMRKSEANKERRIRWFRERRNRAIEEPRRIGLQPEDGTGGEECKFRPEEGARSAVSARRESWARRANESGG